MLHVHLFNKLEFPSTEDTLLHMSPLVLEKTDSDVKRVTTTISDNRHMFVQNTSTEPSDQVG